MTGCENCGGPGPLDEDSVCGDCVTPAAPSWSPAGTGGPAWGAPQCLPSPRPGGRRCESCGGADVYGALDERGICPGCAAADQRADAQRANLAALTVQAHDAAAYARANGTVPGWRCEECGEWSPRLSEDGRCDACLTDKSRVREFRSPGEFVGLDKGDRAAHLL